MNEIYQVEQLAPGFWSITERHVRCFLIEGAEKALLVDAGFGGGDLRGLASSLTDRPVELVITHADGDHTGGCGQFDRVWMHPAEFDRYRSRNPEAPAPMALWEGTVLDLGGVCLEVVLAPGHTPGSILLLDRANRRLLSGDTLQDANVYMFGPGRDLPAFRASMDRLEGLADDFDAVYPAHGALPLTPAIIGRLRAGADALLAGQLEPQPAPPNMPCLLYRADGVGFYYEVP